MRPIPLRSLAPLALLLSFGLAAAPPEAPPAASPPAPAAAPAAAAAPLPTFEEIRARNLEALGGEKAMQAITHLTMTGSMQMPAMGLRGAMVSRMTLPDLSLSTTELPGIGRIVEGLNGEVGWSIDPIRGPSLSDPKEVAQRRLLSKLSNGLGDPRELFDSIEVTGVVEFAGKSCHEVRFTSKDLASTVLYGVDDALTHGMRMTMQSSMGEIPVELQIGGYQRFGELLWPTRTTTKVMGQEQVLVIDRIEFEPIDAATFELPEAIKALVAASKAPAADAPAAGSPDSPEAPASEEPRRRRRPAAASQP